jgi:hypothetical protein
MNIVIKINGINDVCGSVWLATAILTYKKYLQVQGQALQFSETVFSFKQSEIQQLASQICSKVVQNARISQWCNADHPNHTFNYLRAVYKLRRLTMPGEFHGHDEMPENLTHGSSIVCEDISSGQLLSFSELVEWVKNTYSKIIKFDIPRDINIVSKDNLQKHINHTTEKESNMGIPPAATLLKKYSIDFSKLIIQTSFWVCREVFDYITKNNKLNAPGVFYPYAIRKQGAEIQNESPHWKETQIGRRFIDYNHKPQNALAYSLIGKSFQAAISDYTCCHIYGGNQYTHDWMAFTCVANLVLIPRPLQSLTDYDDDVVNCLKQITFLRYGWKPDNQEIKIDDRVRELIPLVREIKMPIEQFSIIWQRELNKYRETYKNTFNLEPDF